MIALIEMNTDDLPKAQKLEGVREKESFVTTILAGN